MIVIKAAYCQIRGDGKTINQDALFNGLAVKQSVNAHGKAVDADSLEWPLRLGVSDGVFDSPSPHQASRFWMNAFSFDTRADFSFLRTQHTDFCAALSGENYGSSATFAGAIIQKNGDCRVAHVGDSRIYLISAAGKWQQIGRDHNILNHMIDAGEANPDVEYADMYHALLYCLCADPYEQDYEIEEHRLHLSTGETLLICSDGLSNALNAQELQTVWAQKSDLAGQLELLRKAVRRQPGYDDLSIVACRKEDAC